MRRAKHAIIVFMSFTSAVAFAAAAIAVLLAVLFFLIRKQKAVRRSIIEDRENDSVKYAFIVNPSKPDAAQIVEKIKDFCGRNNIKEPLFIETTLERDGEACAKEALESGADAVIAVGGDGTVRTVASAMTGTEHSMGIIPIGTGNLFARNMNIPTGDIEAAMLIATSHGSRRIDMGKITLLDSPDTPAEPARHGFLIVGGIGFDADMIDDTNPDLKKKISWIAYFVGGMKNLFSAKCRGTIITMDENGEKTRKDKISFRTFIAGNCGQIPGFQLIPGARFDDGLLDFELIDTSAGIIGWMNLFGDVVHQTVKRKPGGSPLSTNSKISITRGQWAEIILDKPRLVEADGDIVGTTKHVRISLEKNALIVRAPAAPDLPDPEETGNIAQLSEYIEMREKKEARENKEQSEQKQDVEKNTEDADSGLDSKSDFAEGKAESDTINKPETMYKTEPESAQE